MLGEAFYKNFKNENILKCTDIDLNEDWLSYLDFREFESYKNDVLDFNPNYLIHLGAFTDLEHCERNVDQTYITNTLSVENATYIANELNIPLIYISTAGIFDGSKNSFDDWDKPNPLGVYARSKHLGEILVQQNVQKHIICRAGWMMGGGPNKDKKFINKIFKKIKNGDKELFIVNDRDGTPTYTHDFANNVKLLMNKELWGLYNMVCGGQTSRYEVAKELLSILGLEKKIKINKVDSNYFKDEYYAPRPLSERLENKKLNLRNYNLMRDWKIALNEYVIKYFSEYL
jgi:dTDP-4-dehydrorhamnose reductase